MPAKTVVNKSASQARFAANKASPAKVQGTKATKEIIRTNLSMVGKNKFEASLYSPAEQYLSNDGSFR